MATTATLKFEFVELEDGYDVKLKGKKIGEIKSILENSGRYSFYLDGDKSDDPRTYRGKQIAAEALLMRGRLVEKYKDPNQLVMAAWANKAAASDQW